MKTIALYMNTLDQKVTSINDFTTQLGTESLKRRDEEMEIFPFKSMEDIMTYSIKGDMTLVRQR